VADGRGKKRDAKASPNDQCLSCGAKCCNYFALPIDEPEDRQDFDDIRWYLLHKGVSVFVEDGDWYIQINNRCSALTREGLCHIYEDRPRICCKYKDADCEYAVPDGEHEVLLRTPQECTAFAEEFLAKKKTGRAGRKPGRRGSSKRTRNGG
jgi:hypothetical protein